MKLKIEHIIIAGLFAWILSLSMCNDQKTITKKERVVFHSRDTTVVHDTIIREVQKHHWHVTPSNVPVVEYTPEQIAKMDTFNFRINDSILTANINAIATAQPIINFDYKVKHFEIKTETIIKDSLVVEPLKNEIGIGAFVGGGQNQFMFAPKVSFHRKNKWTYTVAFDVIGKNVMIGCEKKLKFFGK